MAWKRGSKSLRAPHVNLLPRRYSGSAKMKVLVSSHSRCSTRDTVVTMKAGRK
jgi:hypothetical protein